MKNKVDYVFSLVSPLEMLTILNQLICSTVNLVFTANNRATMASRCKISFRMFAFALLLSISFSKLWDAFLIFSYFGKSTRELICEWWCVNGKHTYIIIYHVYLGQIQIFWKSTDKVNGQEENATHTKVSKTVPQTVINRDSIVVPLIHLWLLISYSHLSWSHMLILKTRMVFLTGSTATVQGQPECWD